MLRFFVNLKLLYKLAIPVAVLLAVIGGIVWTAASGLNELAANADYIVSVTAGRRASLFDMGMQVNQANVDAKNAIIDPGADAVRGYNADFKKSLDAAIADADKIATLADTADWRDIGDKLHQALLAYRDAGQRNIDLAASGDIAGATKLSLGDARVTRRATSDLIDRYLVTAAQQMLDARNAAQLLAQNVLRSLEITVALGLILALSLLGVVAIFLVARPLKKSTATMERLAKGDLAVDVAGTERHDEIGTLARSLQIFKDTAIAAQRLKAEQEELKACAAAEQRTALIKMADTFEASVGGIVDMVAAASTEMQGAAQSLSGTAEETNRQAAAVAAAATQSSSNVASVASATEQLTASIGEIGRQVTQSAAIAGAAQQEVRNANDNVRGLADAAHKIGAVVDLIQTIAAQTNLLALNATIEAARAGNHGKGFAVVASEVKTLADQTAKATGEIAQQVEAIQAATGTAVKALEQIGGTIAKVNQIAATIASAVEQQGAATKDISANVSQVASGTREVTGSIAVVTQAAGNVGTASTQMLGSASELTQQSARLKQEVRSFLTKVRKA